MRPAPKVVQVPDAASMAREAARRFVHETTNTLARAEVFRVALSGGSTPKAMYRLLASPEFRDTVDWSRVQVFFSDERFVPPDSEESNYHSAQEGLLSSVPIRRESVHPVMTVGVTPEDSAARYEASIRSAFGDADSMVPAFDLIFLGMGPDGHTASLFPETDALKITDRIVAPNFVPRLDSWRITFTYPLLNAAKQVMFLVQGPDKAQRVREVLAEGADLPAAGVRPHNGRLVWLLDQSASSEYDLAASRVSDVQRTS